MSAPQPSIFERIASRHVAAFGKAYEGRASAAAVVVSTHAPTPAERAALEASLLQLGYAKSALGWAFVDADGTGGEEHQEASTERLFNLIEGIDPLCVCALDHAACAALSRNYNTPLALEAKTLLLGRECRCFENLDALLSTEAGKRKAWNLLKTLPKLG